MAIKLSETAYKELRAAMRSYTTKGQVERMLTRIQTDAYQQGYIDCYEVTSKKIKQVVVDAVNQVPNPSDDNDGVVIQPAGSEHGTSQGADATDSYSGHGSIEAFTASLPEYDESESV